MLEQETNAYAVLPASQWRGYKEPPEPPPPMPGTWGDHPPLPSQIELAVQETREGGDPRTVLQILDADPRRPARGGAGAARPDDAIAKSAVIYRTAPDAKNHSLTFIPSYPMT